MYQVVWEWQLWRCFDNIRETFEEKGWEHRFSGGDDNETVPLLAESGDHCIVFFERDPGTGECWFELRDKLRRSVVFVRGTHNIPTPEQSARLLADYGVASYEAKASRKRPLYSLPTVPALKEAV